MGRTRRLKVFSCRSCHWGVWIGSRRERRVSLVVRRRLKRCIERMVGLREALRVYRSVGSCWGLKSRAFYQVTIVALQIRGHIGLKIPPKLNVFVLLFREFFVALFVLAFLLWLLWLLRFLNFFYVGLFLLCFASFSMKEIEFTLFPFDLRVFMFDLSVRSVFLEFFYAFLMFVFFQFLLGVSFF